MIQDGAEMPAASCSAASSACAIAGVFTLLPQRLLGQWLWSQLGLLSL